jgi:hypothetical protein
VTAGCFYVDGSGATAVPGSIGWSSTWSLPCGGAGTGAGGFGFCLSDMLKWYRLTNLRALLRVTPPPLDNPPLSAGRGVPSRGESRDLARSAGRGASASERLETCRAGLRSLASADTCPPQFWVGGVVHNWELIRDFIAPGVGGWVLSCRYEQYSNRWAGRGAVVVCD